MSEVGQLSFWGYDEDGLAASNGQRLIYFVECGDYVKIGFTTRDVQDRMVELECGNPTNMKVIGTIAARDGEDDRRLHKQFAIFHHRKEWFRKTPELMSAIQRMLYTDRRRQQGGDESAPIIDLTVPLAAVGAGVMCSWWESCRICKGELAILGAQFQEAWSGAYKVRIKCQKCGHRQRVKFRLALANG